MTGPPRSFALQYYVCPSKCEEDKQPCEKHSEPYHSSHHHFVGDSIKAHVWQEVVTK